MSSKLKKRFNNVKNMLRTRNKWERQRHKKQNNNNRDRKQRQQRRLVAERTNSSRQQQRIRICLFICSVRVCTNAYAHCECGRSTSYSELPRLYVGRLRPSLCLTRPPIHAICALSFGRRRCARSLCLCDKISIWFRSCLYRSKVKSYDSIRFFSFAFFNTIFCCWPRTWLSDNGIGSV